MSPLQQQLAEAHKARQARFGMHASPPLPVVRKPLPRPAAPNIDKVRETLQTADLVKIDDTDLWLYHGVKPPSPRSVVAHILRRTVEELGVPAEDILGTRRTTPIVFARHVFIHRLARNFPQWSYPRLGQAINREHTTVMYVLGKLKKKPKILAEVKAAA